MKFSFHTDEASQLSTGLLGLLCFEDNVGEGTLFKSIDKALDGLVSKLVAEEQFKGKKGQSLLLHTHGRVGAQRLLLVGAGARKDFNPAELRGFGARLVKTGASVQAKSVTAALPTTDSGTVVERHAQFLAEGALLGGYRFDKYLTGDRSKKPEVVEDFKLAVSPDNVDPSRVEPIKRGVQRAEQIAAGVALARDLINEPAGEMTPKKMAEVAQRVAKQHGLEINVLGPKECEKRGMGMFLAVSQGSEEEPRFIHLTYRPKGKTASKKKIALVGKGVTFDSGGLSLKPSNAMEDMKVDMSGAAAVIAAIGVLADLGVPYEVHAFAACTENMPSGKSYKLGDVLKSMNGKTVEINNTDAEGRLTLGDAITYAIAETKPDEIFDFATLTGACMVALGPNTAGVMGNDLSLVERWLAASRLAGEDMWHLPLPDKLRDQLKSEIADMRNTGDRYGGALTAGLFLKEFVGDTPWVHVDIAGPASSDKESGHIPKGGTGFAVSTIVEYLAARE
jgi:leucyl aminopeptidase